MKIKIFLPLWLVCLSCLSCKDFLNLVPKNAQVVANIEDVRTELLTYWAAHMWTTLPVPVYGSSMLSLPIYNDINSQLALYEDNLDLLHFEEHSSINNDCMNRYYESTDWKARGMAGTIWQNGYSSIGFMNAILDDLAKVDHTLADKETIGGEAKVIRAWNILKLLQFFAPYGNDRLGIPLNLDSENVIPGDRLTQTEIYRVIERELLEVLEYKTPGRPWNFFYSPDFIRSVLAEMYLFRAGSAASQATDWESAEKYSGELIAAYEPEDRAEVLRETFAANRVSWSVGNPLYALKLATDRFFRVGGEYMGIWGLNNAQRPTEELWNLYEPEDIRREAWFKAAENDGDTVYYIAKPVTYSWGPVGDILVLYRKADLYLMNVEAKCHIGKEGEAAKMLAAFREFRMPGTTQTVTGEVFAELQKERRKELCFEYGSRWLDMKRWGLTCSREAYDKESGEVKTYTLTADDYRYALPIPYDVELDYNNISQNPGWTNFN